MSTPTRTRLLAVGAVLLLVVALLALLPALAGDRLAARALAEANAAVRARVGWRDASLGLLRSFPDLTLQLDDVTVVGEAPFAGDTLAAVRQVRVALDLVSAVRAALGGSAPVTVRAVALEAPRLRLLALEDGQANWRILRDTTRAKDGAPLAIRLESFRVQDGQLRLDDRAAALAAELRGIGVTLAGDFAGDRVAVTSRTTVDTASVTFGGIRYLRDVRLAVTAGLDADLARRTYTLARGSGLELNALRLETSGRVAATDSALALDLALRAPDTDIKGLLSLVPAAFTRDLAGVQTGGRLAVAGTVRGTYGPSAFPAVTLDATITDGSFRHADLPLAAREIALDLGVRNPGGSADRTVVELRRLHLRLGDDPVDAALVLRTPISDPDIDARVRGRVDLGALRRTVKLAAVQELAGILTADASVRTRLSAVDRGAWESVQAGGTIAVRDLALRATSVAHPVRVPEATLVLAPQRAVLQSFSGAIGGSDLQGRGELDNILAYLLRDEALRGRATVTSRQLLLDEWRTGERATGVIPVPPNLDLALDATVNRLVYGALELRDARTRVRVKDARLTLEEFRAGTLGGALGLTGSYETTDPAHPTFDFGLQLDAVQIPAAFAALATVRQLAPMAKYMQGNVTADLRLTGPLGADLLPEFTKLTGQGTLRSSQVAIREFPPLRKAAQATKLALLNDPTLRAINSQFEIRDGRVRLRPFTVGIGTTTMTVSGSSGIDQSLDYDLGLRLPRALMGGANDAIDGLIRQAAGRGVNLAAAPEIGLGITLRGTILQPEVGTTVGAVAGNAVAAAGEAVQAAVQTKVAATVDSAKLRAAAATARAVQEAEAQAARIRAEAAALAERVQQEANARADTLVARSEGGLRKLAAEAAAKRVRQEGADRAAQIVREGDAKAAAVVQAAQGAAGRAGP